MALKTSLRIITKRIAQAVKKSTAILGLFPGSYVLTGSFDEKSDQISLLLATDQSVDELRLYKETFRELRESFSQDPYVPMHIGLVIRRVQNLDEGYWDNGMAEDEIDLTERFEHDKP